MSMACAMSCLVAPIQAQTRAAAPLEISDVRVVRGSISISAIVQIRIRNNSAIEQRVCIGAYHLLLRPDGDSYAEGGVRDCQMDERYVPIAPKEVLVVERSVLRRDADRDRSMTLQLTMLLFHTAAGMRAPAMLDVDWEGPFLPPR